MFVDVEDDFLSSFEFKKFQSTILGNSFPWFYNDGIISPSSRGDQFTHTFYNNDGREVNSDYFPLVQPFLDQLKVQTLYRVKVNSVRKTFFHRKSGYHTDCSIPNVKTAIFYVNTCNGYTQFKDGGKVKSVENRIVIFDGNLEHQGVSCTNEKRRVVLNFNYV